MSIFHRSFVLQFILANANANVIAVRRRYPSKEGSLPLARIVCPIPGLPGIASIEPHRLEELLKFLEFSRSCDLSREFLQRSSKLSQLPKFPQRVRDAVTDDMPVSGRVQIYRERVHSRVKSKRASTSLCYSRLIKNVTK